MTPRTKDESRASSHTGRTVDVAETYRIGHLAKLSGFPPVVLRAWERRHNLLEPLRTENGFRLYTRRDLSVLGRVRELLDEGHRIGDIARMGRDVLAPEVPSTRPAPGAANAEDYFDGRGEIAWSVLDALPCAVIVTDAGGLVRWVNRGVPLLCGYDLADLHGRSPGSILQGPDTDPDATAHMRAAIADHRTCSVRVVNYHRSGEPYTALLDVAPLGFGANHVGFVGLARRIGSHPQSPDAPPSCRPREPVKATAPHDTARSGPRLR